MKRIVTACVLLLIIVLGCILEYRTVSQTANTLSAAISGQTDSAILHENYAIWQSKKNLLSAIITHPEINQIENSFRRAIQASENEDLNETRLQVAELTGLLVHLSQLQFPYLYNIF